MSERFKITILIIETFLPNLIAKRLDMSEKELWIIFITSITMVFIIEYYGINQKIFDLIKTKLKLNNKIDNKIDNKIGIQQALDFFIEHNIVPYTHYMSVAITINGIEEKPVVSAGLYNLLNYAKDKEITIYGQKTKTIKNIITLPFEKFDLMTFYYKENWSDDLTSIYNNGVLKYTNLHVKKSELDKLVEKYKLPRKDIINP